MEKVIISPKNVCSRQIEVEYENGVISHVKFIGGCQGNTQGVAALLVGRKIDDIMLSCEKKENDELKKLIDYIIE